MKGLFTSAEEEEARKQARKKRKLAMNEDDGEGDAEAETVRPIIEISIGKISLIYGHKVFMAHLEGRRPRSDILTSVYDAFDELAKEYDIVSPLERRTANISTSTDRARQP